MAKNYKLLGSGFSRLNWKTIKMKWRSWMKPMEKTKWKNRRAKHELIYASCSLGKEILSSLKRHNKKSSLKADITWQRANHVRRRKDWRWTTLTTEWSPTDGWCIKGRQRRRRIDGLVAFAGPTWLRLTQERDAERHKGVAFVLQGLNGGCDEDDGEDGKDEDDYINIKKEHT